MFDPEERQRINPFDWEAEFPTIFSRKSRGLDAIVGNPPYIRMEEFKNIKEYLRRRYRVHASRSDMYAYFVEQSHALLRSGGLFSMILSNKFVKAGYGLPLRRFIAENTSVKTLADFAGLRVFSDATVRPVVLCTEKRCTAGDTVQRATYLPPPDRSTFGQLAAGTTSIATLVESRGVLLPPGSLSAQEWLTLSAAEQKVICKMKQQGTPLAHFVEGKLLWGVKTGLNKAFVIDAETRARLIAEDAKSEGVIKPFLFGEDVRRYAVRFGNRYLIYAYHGIDIKAYPAVEAYLAPFKKRLRARATKQKWYELQQPSVALVPVFTNPKIIYPEIGRECRFTVDTEGYFSNNKTFLLPTADTFLLGVLNSKAAFYYFAACCAALEGSGDRYLEFRAIYLRDFPVPDTARSGNDGQTKRDAISELADRMLRLHRHVAETDHGKTVLMREIAATDRKIDQLVYELYGLTDEEICLVEEATTPRQAPPDTTEKKPRQMAMFDQEC